MERVISFVGIIVLIGMCYLLSENKKAIDKKLVFVGISTQFLFAFIILKTGPGRWFFQEVSGLITMLLDFTKFGSQFLFGDLMNTDQYGFIFVFQVLPTIIFFSALMNVLYYLGIMQFIVKNIAGAISKLLGTSRAESLSVSANIFVGQTEAPLVIKPYIEKMTRSELLAVMVGGMATVAGGVMAGYVGMGVNAGHLLSASIMAAPGALVISKILIPETETPVTKNDADVEIENNDANVIDAAARGASEGLQLALNVAAMLLAFVALIAMVNAIFGFVGGLFGMPGLSLEKIMGLVFSPIALLMGIPMNEVMQASALIGQKTVINEFVAYSNLSEYIRTGALSPRTITVLTYALCGFANFSSIAIQLGGIGGIAPSRRSEIAGLGVKALIGGATAGFLNACIAGVLY